MELFDIERGRLILNPNSLYVPEFRRIWERDKMSTKDQATKEIAYVTFMCNLSNKNPYNAYSERDKAIKITQDIFGDINYKPDDVIKEAMKKYTEMQSTTYTRLLKSSLKAADKLAEYFEMLDFTKLDSMGKPVYTVRDLGFSLKEVGNIIKSLTSLEKQVQKDQLESVKVRGDNEIGMYETPKKKNS